MKIEEITELLRLLQRLPENKQREFYFILKGAALVVDNMV